MTNPLKTDRSISLGLLLARLPIGAFFLLAGIAKLRMGVDAFVAFASHSGSVPRFVPGPWVHNYLYAIPYLEVTVGALLILGLFARLGGLIGSLMLISFIVGYTGLHGTDPASQSLPFHWNFILLGIMLAIFLVGPGRISLDGMIFGRRSAKHG